MIAVKLAIQFAQQAHLIFTNITVTNIALHQLFTRIIMNVINPVQRKLHMPSILSVLKLALLVLHAQSQLMKVVWEKIL